MKTPLNHSRAITIGDRNEHQPENPEVVRKRLTAMDSQKLRWFANNSRNALWKALAQELVSKASQRKPRKQREPRKPRALR